MPTKSIGRGIATAFAALSLAPAGAQATEYCVVPASGCDLANDPNAHPTFGAAIAAADANPDADVIRLGAATYRPETAVSVFETQQPVEIRGAGRGQTIIGPGDTGFFTIGIFGANSVIRDLTILHEESVETEYGLGVLGAGSVADNIEVLGADDLIGVGGPGGDFEESAVILQNGPVTLRNSYIRLPTGPGRDTWGVELFSSAPGTKVENTTIIAEKGVVAMQSSQATAKGLDITAHRGFMSYGNGSPNVSLDNSVIRAIPGLDTSPYGLYALANGSSLSPVLTARNVTLLGDGAVGSVGARAEENPANCGGNPPTPTGSATLNLHNVASYGYARAGQAVGCLGAPACPGAASARIVHNHSAFSTGITNTTSGCNSNTGGSIFPGSNFGFVSDSDPRPRFGSALVDAGAPGAIDPAESQTDFAGLNRLVDGDGDATARRDIGAYEYQRRAPTVTASASPSSGPPGTTFAFTAVPSDADGDPVTQFVWDFDSMFQATGESANQAFTSLGDHVGTVTVTDASGMKGSGTATVNVANPPVVTPTPTPTPTVAPPKPDTTAPVVTIKGGTLKVDKKRKAKVTITCPATETAPCSISMTASSAKKIALKRGKRKKITSLGKGSGSVAQGKSATVTLTLTKAVYAYLKKKKKLPATLKVTATDAAGNKATASAKATLKK